MMTEQGRRGGARSAISDDEIVALLDDGMNYSEIARHFTDRGRSITQQAISLRVRKIRDKEEDRSKYILPWSVRSPAHTQGWVYRAAVAYGKRQSGRGISPQDVKLAKDLEAFLLRQDAVLSYDYNEGFVLRNRRPGDRDGLLV